MKFDIFESVCFNCATWKPYSRESQIGWCPEGYVRGKTEPVFTDKNDCCGRWKTMEPEEILEELEPEVGAKLESMEEQANPAEVLEEIVNQITEALDENPEPEIGAAWSEWEIFYRNLQKKIS